jgi:hypothetical protein
MAPRKWVRTVFMAGLIFAQIIPLPASAVTRSLVINPNGTFSTTAGGTPWITINSGDIVNFVGLERNDSIVRIASVPSTAQGKDVCYQYDPVAANQDQYLFKRPYDGSLGAVNEFTGPTRQGLSGIWALAPEGGKVSYVETIDAECSTLSPTSSIAGIVDGVAYTYSYTFTEPTFHHGQLALLAGEETNIATGGVHRLCEGTTSRCLAANPAVCTTMSNAKQNFDAYDPHAIPPGAYLGGLMDSTYLNPDVMGVVVRVSWNDVQRDDGTGKIVFNFKNIDREFQRALTHGKFVTIDVRAGRYGTPDWLFTDYLKPTSQHHAGWCTTSPCTLTGPTGPKPPGAGAVIALELKDYYDEDEDCGVRFRIGHPADTNYRDAYAHMITQLAAHIAQDSRRFAALAHVKVSGLNLQTSEAELPHHCDDKRLASGFPITSTERDASYVPVDVDLDGDYDDAADTDLDDIVDVWKKIAASGAISTEECLCNPKIWHDSVFGYTPEMVFDYYTEMEHEIVTATFGKKSLGYQIIQDGFPRANSVVGGGFYGDHLYEEVLVESTAPSHYGLPINACVATDLNSMVDACSLPTGLIEDAAAETVGYCSLDTADFLGLSPADHCSVQLDPAMPDPLHPGLRAHDEPDDRGLAGGARYPGGTEQSEQILLRARTGQFGNPSNPAYANYPLGKLFVPQHSGMQPLPLEQDELGFQGPLSQAGKPFDVCKQQSTARPPPNPLPPQFAPGAVGTKIATFPMTSSNAAVGLVDHEPEITSTYNGCPNAWIVQEGAIAVLNGPPLLTGFQNTNGVRSLDHLESSLMNLVYNTNGVFLEIYEDVFWRASMQKGTGPFAAPLSSPGIRTAGGLCDYTDPVTKLPDYRFCYSKSLSQWGEELHLRRWKVASSVSTNTYPALADPFPTQYSFTFVNPTPGVQREYYFINPARCNPALVNPGSAAQPSNGLVRIRVN